MPIKLKSEQRKKPAKIQLTKSFSEKHEKFSKCQKFQPNLAVRTLGYQPLRNQSECFILVDGLLIYTSHIIMSDT